METKVIRNNANIRVEIPQYVNLRVYMCGFEVSVTLNIDEYTAAYINKRQPSVYGHCELFTFQKRTRKGDIRTYVSIKRSYTDLNMIQYACWNVAASDLKTLKILIREAKIAKLNEEINNLYF